MVASCSPVSVNRAASALAEPLSPRQTPRCKRQRSDESDTAVNFASPRLPLLGTTEATKAPQQRALVKRARRAVRAAQGQLQLMRASLRSSAKKHAECRKEACRHQAVEEESRRLLVEEAWLSEAQPRPRPRAAAARRLARYLGELGAEASLTASVPEVVLKSPDERTWFDKTVVDSTMFFMQHHKSILDSAMTHHMACQSKLEAAVAKQMKVVEAAVSASSATSKRLSMASPAKKSRKSMHVGCFGLKQQSCAGQPFLLDEQLVAAQIAAGG